VIQQWESEPNHDSKDIREVLGFNLLWKGETLARMDKIRAALASYREGIASFEAAANKSAPHAVELAAGHTKTGAAPAAMGKRQDAAAAYQKALAIVEPLAAAQPADFAALYAAADAYFGMGGLSKLQALCGGSSAEPLDGSAQLVPEERGGMAADSESGRDRRERVRLWGSKGRGPDDFSL
jgi:tetratricopeptide (TPR) repeat protein